MKLKLFQPSRSLGIHFTCSLYLLCDRISYADLSQPIGWRDHLRWWIEGKLDTMFGWLWHGSDEEILAVERDEVPLKYMSDRQLIHWHRLQIQMQDSVRLLTWRPA